MELQLQHLCKHYGTNQFGGLVLDAFTMRASR